jgi:tRNA pseudouridine13 synthase
MVLALVPHRPPLWTEDLPAVGGAIGSALEDFVVDEVPAYLPSGSGDHWYVRAEKRGMNTRDAALAIARATKIPERDIGYAGMKDRHGITTQWLSVPAKAPAPESWQLPPELRLVEVSRHNNKLRTGHLRGNRFRIGLTGVGPGGDERARSIFERLAKQGHANYFGSQRFGRDGRNLEDAVAWLTGKAPLARGRERFLSKLYTSALQSEIFNRYATRRLELGADRLLAGEVVRLAGAGASFVVEDPAREQHRLLGRDLCLTGPMPGPKMRAATADAAALEAAVLAELGLGADALGELGRQAPGTRRDLLVLPLTPSVGELEGDRLELAFELPSGSYATMLVRELTRADETTARTDG